SEPQVLLPRSGPMAQAPILSQRPMSTVSAQFCSTCLPDVHHSWVPIRFPLFARRLKRRHPNSARWHHRSIATWRRFAPDASNVIQKRATSPLATSQPTWNAGSTAVQSSPARFHLRRGSGVGRSAIPNWLEQRLPVSFYARLRFGYLASTSSEVR